MPATQVASPLIVDLREARRDVVHQGESSVEVISYLKRAQVGFIIPAMVRGRKPKPGKKATGLCNQWLFVLNVEGSSRREMFERVLRTNTPCMRAIRKKKHGYYQHTLTGKVNGKQRSTKVTVCVASKNFKHKKSGKRRQKKLLFVVWKVRLSPSEIRENYRTRFGIETSYRQMHEARIKTCTRDPRLRLLFVGIALVLRNVWVWLHFKLAKGKWDAEPQLFLELLRFREMLLWIAQVIEKYLGANQSNGIENEAYQQLTGID